MSEKKTAGEKLLDALLDGLRYGSLLQGLVTFILIGLYGFLVVTARAVPQELSQWMGMVIAFWLGSKTAPALSGAVERLRGGSK